MNRKAPRARTGEDDSGEIWLYDGLRPIGYFVGAVAHFDAFLADEKPLGRFASKDGAIAAIASHRARASNRTLENGGAS